MRSATERLRLSCLVLAAAVPYLNALGAGFTFDDRGVIVQNEVVHASAPPLVELFTEPYQPGALYRPLTHLTYWANHRLHGLDPAWFHAVNIALHVVVTMLVYRLALTMRISRTIAFTAALVFAVHPIHTEAVTSVVGRAELLSAIAVLGGLLCAWRSRRPQAARAAWLAAAAALFGAGLLCKENAFVFLPLLVVVAWIGEGQPLRQVLVRLNLTGELPLFAGIGVAYLLLRWTLFGTLTVGAEVARLDNPLAHVSTEVRLATAASVLSDSIAQLALPLQLSADYSYDQIPVVDSLSDPRLFVATALLLGLGLLFWELRRHSRAAAGGALFFLAAISLTSNFLFPIGTIRAERLLYLPSVGFCLVAGAAAAWALERSPRAAVAALAVVLLAGSARTWVRNGDWATERTLYEATVRTSPRSAKAHHNLGVALDRDREYAESALAHRRSLAIDPTYEDAAFGIGCAAQRRGMTALALHWYEETIRLDPRHTLAHFNRGATYFNIGDIEAAEAAFRRGLAEEPEQPQLLMGLGFVRLAEGNPDAAREVLEQSRSLDPNDPQTRRALQLAMLTSAGGGERD